MTGSLKTVVYRLRHDPDTSARIGYLASQYRLAYNVSVTHLNRHPNVPFGSGHRGQTSLLNTINAWRDEDSRASAPRAIHHAGAFEAYRDNRLLQIRREGRLQSTSTTIALEHGGHHRRTLDTRSRKRDGGTLSSYVPPARLGETSFCIPGARDVVLRTTQPVPEDLDIQAYRLVEVRRDRRGMNGPLRARRYALHLMVAVTLPDPPEHEKIIDSSDIIGMTMTDDTHMYASTGEKICLGGTTHTNRRNRANVRSEKPGSRRHHKLQRSNQRTQSRQKADRQRLITEGTRQTFSKHGPNAVAVHHRASPIPTDDFTRGIHRDVRKPHVMLMRHQLETAIRNSLMPGEMRAVADEAERTGIKIYRVLPEAPQPYGSPHTSRHRDRGESQAVDPCRRCEHEMGQGHAPARVLRDRAYLMARLASGRELVVECAQTGWRVRPSRDAWDSPCGSEGVVNPKSGVGRQGVGPLSTARGAPKLQGAALQVGSSDPDAQKQLIIDPTYKHTITNLEKLPVEIVAVLLAIVGAGLARKTKQASVTSMATWANFAIANGLPVIPADPSIWVSTLHCASCGTATSHVR